MKRYEKNKISKRKGMDNKSICLYFFDIEVIK